MSITGNEESWLPFQQLSCSGCPYFVTSQCSGDGDATAESFFMRDESVISCLDPTKQIRHYSDLARIRPVPQVALHDKLHLPEIVFGINDAFKQFPEFSDEDYFCISFKSLVDQDGFFKYRTPQKLRLALKISPTSKLGLICVASDPVLENFWSRSSRSSAWQRIADFGFAFSTSLSFSVYDKYPRFDQIHNRERNFVTHDLLLEKGVQSIPFIFFFNDKDFSETIRWLQQRPDVTKLAIHAQQTNDAAGIRNMIRGMTALQQHIDRELHFVVVGVFGIGKCAPLRRLFPRLTVITNTPLYCATAGRKLLPDLNQVKMSRQIDGSTLAVPNMDIFKSFYMGLKL